MKIFCLSSSLKTEKKSVNKRQNSFSSFENKIRSPFDRNESNGSHRTMDDFVEPLIARKHVSDSQMSSILDRRHLEDVTNHQQELQQQQTSSPLNRSRDPANKTLIIDDALTKLDPVSIYIAQFSILCVQINLNSIIFNPTILGFGR